MHGTLLFGNCFVKIFAIASAQPGFPPNSSIKYIINYYIYFEILFINIFILSNTMINSVSIVLRVTFHC